MPIHTEAYRVTDRGPILYTYQVPAIHWGTRASLARESHARVSSHASLARACEPRTACKYVDKPSPLLSCSPLHAKNADISTHLLPAHQRSTERGVESLSRYVRLPNRMAPLWRATANAIINATATLLGHELSAHPCGVQADIECPCLEADDTRRVGTTLWTSMEDETCTILSLKDW